MPPLKRRRAVLALGAAQTIAWASSYYLPAILAAPIARDLGIPVTWVFAAFSGALVVTALLGPRIGSVIDRLGERGVLVASNGVLAAGLVMLALCAGPLGLAVAWLVIGVGMALGLYDAAFATLTRLYGRDARRPITGITLIAGLASTVGWPLTAALDAAIDWRGACLVWAAIHVGMALPLNLLVPTAAGVEIANDALSSPPAPSVRGAPSRAMLLLAVMFAAVGFVSSAMSAHLPGLLAAGGVTPAAAVAAAALVGPAQVAARLVEAAFLTRYHPLVAARLATIAHPLGVAAFLVVGPLGAPALTLLYGGGNGIVTIVRGTLPLALFGPMGYGRLTGLLNAPARLAQAAAPLAFGLLVQAFGVGALWASAALSLIAFAALMALPSPSSTET